MRRFALVFIVAAVACSSPPAPISAPARCAQIRASSPTDDVEAQFRFGRDEFWACHDCLRDTGCFTRVVRRLEHAAGRGHLKAAEELAIVYSRVAGPEARTKQLDWARRAAEAGGPEQAHQYATYLMSSKESPDIDGALEWFTRAANEGYRRSMYELASLFNDGRRVPRNYELANRWWRRLADAGVPAGMVLLGMNIQSRYGSDGPDSEAVRLYRRAYAAGDTGQAPYLLGLSYEFGRGVPKSSVEAIHWYGRVRGTVHLCTALFRTGRLYEIGDGVAADVRRALEYYERARHADPYQCWSLYEHLAALEERGVTGSQNPARAEELRRKAATTRWSYRGPAGRQHEDPYATLLALDRR